jgi:enoyl-CoA hydratase
MSQPEFKTLIVTSEGPVTKIIINRSEAMNSLTPEVISELETALTSRCVPHKTRVVVIEGSGTKAFVAGADIATMADYTPAQALAFARHGQTLTKMIEEWPALIIAKVRGFALGGGNELAMACDMVIAARNAKFGQPEVNLGLIAGFGGTQRLVKRVGLPVAIDMLCTGRGRMLSADEAAGLGLVSRVVDDDKLDAEVEMVVNSILKAAPEAVIQSKQLARASEDMTLSAGLAAEAQAFAHCFAGSEAREGTRAFLEKRSPKFTN